jgi:hypothetical protein
MRGPLSALALMPLLLLPFGCTSPPPVGGVGQPVSAIRGVCRVGTSGGSAGGGGQRPAAPEEGVKVIVRDGRGKKTVAEATSGKGGEFEVPLAPGKYQVEAVLQRNLLCDHCVRAVEVKPGEVVRVELNVYIIQP